MCNCTSRSEHRKATQASLKPFATRSSSESSRVRRAAKAPSPADAGPRHPRNRGTETGLRSPAPEHTTLQDATSCYGFSARPPGCGLGSSLPQGRLGSVERTTLDARYQCRPLLYGPTLLHSHGAILEQREGHAANARREGGCSAMVCWLPNQAAGVEEVEVLLEGFHVHVHEPHFRRLALLKCCVPEHRRQDGASGCQHGLVGRQSAACILRAHGDPYSDREKGWGARFCGAS